jgi:hypothetical protein
MDFGYIKTLFIGDMVQAAAKAAPKGRRDDLPPPIS